MPLKKILFAVLLFSSAKINASTFPEHGERMTLQLIHQLAFGEKEAYERPSPLLERIRLKRSKGKKVTAALLAFPFPCGIVGLHRIYLGSAPYVPVVYIATLGGAFGILPFIDFCVLLIDKDLEPYISNDKVFMWVN